MRLPRLVLLTVLAAALAIVYISNVFGQTYQRHALIEEGTGTWCQYCPFGAWEIDSVEHRMGSENVVVISYHGPSNSADPLMVKQHDTMYNAVQATGWPWCSVGRVAAFGGGASDLYYTVALNDAQQAPLVDFRVVNATYNSSNSSVDFDLDITPFDLRQMPTEDTATFVVVSVVTEDGIVAAQELNGVGTIDNFVHHNVARAFGSKVLGDAVVLGTKTSVSWPVRKHYHISTSDKGVDDFVQDSLKIKALVARKSKTASNGEVYLDAGQTAYITKLPSTATRSVWTVLPREGDNVGGNTMPIVWGRGGGAAANAKIEYSINNGTSWSIVTASAPTSPYQWTIPDDAFGASVMLRVTDAQDASVTMTTGVFSIAPRPYFTLDNPVANDTLWIGKKDTVTWTSYNGGENDKLEYSTDGSTWITIANVSTKSSYVWTVPAAAEGGTVTIRISDGAGAQGVSGAFAVVSVGTINTITIDGGPNFKPNQNTTVHWTRTGYLGKTLRVQILNNTNKPFVWQGLAAELDASLTESPVQMPAWPATGTWIRLVADEVGVMDSSAAFDISNSSGGVASGPNATNGVRVSPDPLSSHATVSFTLDEASSITLSVRDLLGREVLRLTPGTLGAGAQTLALDASNLPAGTYTYVLLAAKASYEGKLVIVR